MSRDLHVCLPQSQFCILCRIYLIHYSNCSLHFFFIHLHKFGEYITKAGVLEIFSGLPKEIDIMHTDFLRK